ncbi:hypothetical protein C8R47DRAFT_1224148 [Mycena vitilis]|nr:hypothetical protein C8R47DRAFT_1224148 [Mycena vitilis]
MSAPPLHCLAFGATSATLYAAFVNTSPLPHVAFVGTQPLLHAIFASTAHRLRRCPAPPARRLHRTVASPLSEHRPARRPPLSARRITLTQPLSTHHLARTSPLSVHHHCCTPPLPPLHIAFVGAPHAAFVGMQLLPHAAFVGTQPLLHVTSVSIPPHPHVAPAASLSCLWRHISLAEARATAHAKEYKLKLSAASAFLSSVLSASTSASPAHPLCRLMAGVAAKRRLCMLQRLRQSPAQEHARRLVAVGFGVPIAVCVDSPIYLGIGFHVVRRAHGVGRYAFDARNRHAERKREEDALPAPALPQDVVSVTTASQIASIPHVGSSPLCHRPRLDSKAEVDMITHIARHTPLPTGSGRRSWASSRRPPAATTSPFLPPRLPSPSLSLLDTAHGDPTTDDLRSPPTTHSSLSTTATTSSLPAMGRRHPRQSPSAVRSTLQSLRRASLASIRGLRAYDKQIGALLRQKRFSLYKGDGGDRLYCVVRAQDDDIADFRARRIEAEEFRGRVALNVKMGHTSRIERRMEEYSVCDEGQTHIWAWTYRVPRRKLAERLVHLEIFKRGGVKDVHECPGCYVWHREFVSFSTIGSLGDLDGICKDVFESLGWGRLRRIFFKNNDMADILKIL